MWLWHLSDIRHDGADKRGEEAGVGGVLRVVVVLVQPLLQLEGQRVVVVPHHLQDLVLGGGGQLLHRQPRVDARLEVRGDGADVDKGVRDPHGGVLVLAPRLQPFIILLLHFFYESKINIYRGISERHGVEIIKSLVTSDQLVVELVIRGGRGEESVAVGYEHVEDLNNLRADCEEI